LELLFNLIWVVLSTGLLGFWLSTKLRQQDDGVRSSLRVQIAALAVLVIILFPVVSITDDLLVCTAPAKAEHLIRQDLQDLQHEHTSTTSHLIATLLSFQNPSGTLTSAHFCSSTEAVSSSEQYLSIVGNRPPPRV
jgi:hypothetical protein